MTLKSGLMGIILLLSAFFSFSCADDFELMITNGTIYDGSGNAPVTLDIGINEGIITAVGDLSGKRAAKTIDAAGLYIAPGFIDIHNHADRTLRNEESRNAKNYLLQGATTLVTGNCGSGTPNVGEYFSELESNGVGLNVVHLVGQGAVRRNVLGQADREPTSEELDEMRAIVKRAMEEGAVGMSTGLFYAPGNFAKTAEVTELAKELKAFNGIYTSHIRDESNYSIGLVNAVKEAIQIGETAGVPVQISHIKALGKPVWGKSVDVTNIIEEAQKRGVKVLADQYPYSASSTGLIPATIPRWVQVNGQLRNLLTDESQLPKIKKEIAANIDRRGGPETLVISSFRQKPEYEGKNLLEVSEILGKNPVDTAIELVLLGGPGVISHNMKEEDVIHFMRKPYVMTASDGNVPVFGNGVPHPRSYGTFPRKIRKYVLDEKVITMEHFVRSATSLPADMLNLNDRGWIKENYVADIVIFDPEKINELATFEEPHQYSVGVIYLFVNGEITVDNGEYTGTLAGKALRNNR